MVPLLSPALYKRNPLEASSLRSDDLSGAFSRLGEAKDSSGRGSCSNNNYLKCRRCMSGALPSRGLLRESYSDEVN